MYDLTRAASLLAGSTPITTPEVLKKQNMVR
jgi:hypothetical protein